ncbi:hypothetical protein OTU49_010469 [Cherax quadricarinatus]|uniref:Uncharacterized protein n=1 Tax=Cherax quadricarinatus TaxID=27406 RepID=A0AAW0WDG1_CHEQU
MDLFSAFYALSFFALHLFSYRKWATHILGILSNIFINITHNHLNIATNSSTFSKDLVCKKQRTDPSTSAKSVISCGECDKKYVVETARSFELRTQHQYVCI